MYVMSNLVSDVSPRTYHDALDLIGSIGMVGFYAFITLLSLVWIHTRCQIRLLVFQASHCRILSTRTHFQGLLLPAACARPQRRIAEALFTTKR
jgi:hypothetical protein